MSLLLAIGFAVGTPGRVAAAPVPPIERKGGGTVAISGGALGTSAAIDLGLGHGLVLGLAGNGGGQELSQAYGAGRLSHRLWAGPGGSAVGYMLGANWLRRTSIFGSEGGRLEVMTAFVGTFVLDRGPDYTLIVRASYGPVLAPYLVRTTRQGSPPAGEWVPWPQALNSVEWPLNPEIAILVRESVEVFFAATRAEFGVRYHW